MKKFFTSLDKASDLSEVIDIRDISHIVELINSFGVDGFLIDDLSVFEFIKAVRKGSVKLSKTQTHLGVFNVLKRAYTEKAELQNTNISVFSGH